MSATIIFDSQDYARRLEQAGFTPQQAEILKEHGEHLRAALQPLLLDTRLEIERVRAEVEKVRAETEKVRAELKVDIESTRAEVEKVRADLKVEIEKVRADLKTDIEKVRAEAEKNKYDLLKWQIGIGLGLVAVMAKGFGWLGF